MLSQQLKKLGPGLLYAGAAVGVSHLVQSTRAGAEFGTQLLWAVVLANFTKYPFLWIGPKYTAVTGKSLLDGYFKISPWALLLVMVLTISTMFTVQAAVTLVTAGLVIEIFSLQLNAKVVTALILVVCAVILLVGRYQLLDKFIKYIILLLSLTSLVAVIAAWQKSVPVISPQNFEWSNSAHLLFLVALMGWMPAPLDISIWHSMWSVAKNQQGGSADVHSARLDFNIGFYGTVVLALIFVFLGSFVMYGRGEVFSPKAGEFAGQVIRLYTTNIGAWSYPLIAFAALITMFSTSITCLDAFPRVLQRAGALWRARHESIDEIVEPPLLHYAFWLALTCLGALVLLFGFIDNMKTMVTMATVISFVVAPVYATLNYMAMSGEPVPAEHRPQGLFRGACWLGIAVLALFSLWFLVLQYFS